jgi:hypothetical protein
MDDNGTLLSDLTFEWDNDMGGLFDHGLHIASTLVYCNGTIKLLQLLSIVL